MPAMDISDFATLLRYYRRRSGLTQEALAERAGLSAASVSLLERGITLAPQRATVSLLNDALALSPDEAADFFAKAHGSRRQSDTGDEDAQTSPDDTHDTYISDLPVPLTALIGREHEQAALLEMLRHDTTRLLTLTGPAGVGKTRLALELAATLRREHGADVVFVGLVPILEPERVLPTIALAMGIHETDSRPVREGLIQMLRHRALVLVLDNFEQVLPAARAVLELLIACPHIKALVTSRSALNVRGEQCFPVSPLALPDLTQLDSLEGLRRAPTVALFLDRARAAWPDFSVTTLAEGRLVAAICKRLDGLPLAIELAAARARHFGLRQLHDRLSEPTFLGVLAEGAQDLADHQRTMRSAIAWSYELLNAEEQRLFRWLGVFVGGTTSDAAEAVTGVAEDALMANVTALVNASLLQYVDIAGTRRYMQLVMLQAYAQERLRDEGEWEEARRRHADYFLELAEVCFAATGDQLSDVTRRIEAEYENVRAALAWAWEAGATMHGVRMAGALRRFWATHSYFLEGLDWLERFIKRAGTPASLDEKAALAEAWTGVLVLSHRLDRFERARDAGEMALALRREVGDTTQIAYAMMNLANPVKALREYERAHALYEECLVLHRETGNREGQIFPLMNLGGLFYDMGRPHEALAYYDESLAISREVGETDYARALTWNNIGEVYIILDEPWRAIEVTEPNYRLFVSMSDTYGSATCAFTLGRAYWRCGDLVAARAYLNEAEGLYRNLGSLGTVARILYFRASIAIAEGDLEATRSDLTQALRDLSGQSLEREDIWWLAERAATLARYCGAPEQAARLYAAGTTHRDAIGGLFEPAERAMRAADLEWLQATLGEATLVSALVEGEALSHDDVMVLLRQTLQNEPDCR